MAPSDRLRPATAAAAQGPTGLVAGTLIWTGDGVLPVEFLVPGDRVVTRDGVLPLLRLDLHHALTGLVRLRADALAPGRPEMPITLPAAQSVYVRGALAHRIAGADEAMVAAATLVRWRLAETLGRRALQLHAPVFERPSIYYASGVELGADTVPA